MGKMLFHVRIFCDNCNGTGRAVPSEITEYESKIKRAGISASERSKLWQDFKIKHQYDPETKERACKTCEGKGYREEWVKLVNAEIEVEVKSAG